MGNVFFYHTDIGKIGIEENGASITKLYFNGETIQKNEIAHETALLREAGKQMMEYLAGKRKLFDLPIAPSGTSFQQKVWKALLEIPYGETQSYGEIAERIEQKKAYRAVGMANNKNPIPIFIPCHRVIGANGKLVGYGGGIEIKEYLLNLEKRNCCLSKINAPLTCNLY